MSAGFVSLFIVVGSITRLFTDAISQNAKYVSLVIGIGACVAGPDIWRLVAWLMLAATLIAKARREEVGLLAQFPEYHGFRRGRAFLIPGIW